MAARLSFHYRPGGSLLHLWDPRCKLLGLLVSTFCLMHMQIPALSLFTLFLVMLLPAVGLDGRRTVSELRFWGWLLLLIFIAQAAFTPGTSLFPDDLPPFTEEGVARGALSIWRLVLMLGFGLIFSATTRPRDVGEAMRWFLDLLRIPSGGVSFMAALTMRFIPLLLDASDEIRAACRARALDRRRAPWRHARVVFLPLLRHTLLRSEDLTHALAARACRLPSRTRLEKAPLLHVLALVLFALTAVASLLL